VVFFIAMEPSKVLTMMDHVLDDLSASQSHGRSAVTPEQVAELRKAVHEMETNKRAVILGRERMRAMNKRVGERFQLTGINFKGIDLEFEIAGVFPPGRYDQNAVMNRDYLNDAVDTYPKTHAGAKHPMAEKSLPIVWLQVADREAFQRVAGQVDASGQFLNPAVKCQTLSAGLASWLDVYRDMIWGMRWLLAPAVLITMVLVISNAISISVRERRGEMAVLKVLGFRPGQILALVLGEGLLVGTLSGLLSVALTYLAVNQALQQNALQLYVPADAFWWGPAMGALTALAGSVLPAWSATTVNVSAVFSRVA
jgi:putative ABC transport system permease protein